MSDHPALMSEEDIRTKVVYTWLADHGFTPESISLEFSFEVHLGRNTYRVGKDYPHSPIFRPRSDVLVRSSDGRNLMIIEVKAPHEKLDNDTKEQGISYARILRTGGIAPFVVVTNGHRTHIFDSITGESLEGACIPKSHPYAQNGFRVCVDDISLRAEALKTFISLSPNNLLTFCKAQVLSRMRMLCSDDPFSGKKYIPQLYIHRSHAEKRLDYLLNQNSTKSIVVFGAPQVGKTNFVCHSALTMLQKGIPCLFYPAIGMQQGLLEEVFEDFSWEFSENFSHQYLINRLEQLLSVTEQELIIFIDGWNEANYQLARAIDRASEKLSRGRVKIVISLTNVSAQRLLIDDADNPSWVAETSRLSKDSIPLLELSPDSIDSSCSILEVCHYDSQEIEEAYRVYSKIYNVLVPDNHRKIKDPFLLRIAMDCYTNSVLPEALDEPFLLEKSIRQKARRAVGIEEETIIALLIELAQETLKSGQPIGLLGMRSLWRLSAFEDVPQGIFDAAILAKVRDNQNFLALDFYYERERDFVVAHWICKWHIKTTKDFCDIFLKISRNDLHETALSAIYWFLRQPINFLYVREISSKFDLCENSSAKIVVLNTIRKNPVSFELDDIEWIYEIAEKGIGNSDILVKAEAAKLISKLSEDEDWLVSILEDDEDNLQVLIHRILEVDDDHSLDRGSIGQVILDAIRKIHWKLSDQAEGESEITKILQKLLCNPFASVRTASAKAFGYISPELFFKTLSFEVGLSQHGKEITDNFIPGIELAINELGEQYYGSMCPGYLHQLEDDPEEHLKDFTKMKSICIPVVNFYWPSKCSKDLNDLLNGISPSDRILENHLNGNTEYLERIENQNNESDPNIVQLEINLEFQ